MLKLCSESKKPHRTLSWKCTVTSYQTISVFQLESPDFDFEFSFRTFDEEGTILDWRSKESKKRKTKSRKGPGVSQKMVLQLRQGKLCESIALCYRF